MCRTGRTSDVTFLLSSVERMHLVLVASVVGLAAGHGHMTYPPARQGGSLINSSYWFSNNVEITVNETLPVEARSVTNGGSPDMFRTSPWRAPGYAQVYGSGCGVAGGSLQRYANGGFMLDDRAQGFDGKDLPEMDAIVWQLGTSVEVAWTIMVNHGGGYQYRLCKKSNGISEECFQQTPLKFAGNTSAIVKSDGSKVDFPMTKVTKGTWPVGSEWARNPVPGCKICDSVHDKCGPPLPPIPMGHPGGGLHDPWTTQVECIFQCSGGYVHPLPKNSTGLCPTGTEFFPALGGESGFRGRAFEVKFNIMDKVVIPSYLDEGEYLLSWRWDSEGSQQVFQNCADIRLTKGLSTPAGAPSVTQMRPANITLV